MCYTVVTNKKEKNTMINKKYNLSVIISLVLAFITLVFLVVLTFSIPSLVDSYLEITKKTEFSSLDATWIKAILYVILLPAFVADISLLALLNLVASGKVFTNLAVYLLRLISICCFAEVILFGALSIFFLLSLVVSFAALFLGIVLRVVKNVIEEATLIKNENDFTG